jgi:hypothetical protein
MQVERLLFSFRGRDSGVRLQPARFCLDGAALQLALELVSHILPPHDDASPHFLAVAVECRHLNAV